MAKAPQNTAANPAVLFKIEMGEAPPAIQRLVGGAKSPYSDFMKAMPAPKNGKYSQFFIPTEVPATITDAAEREKAGKDAARKIANRVSGVARRITKEDATVAYAIRTRVENGVHGVRVYRTDPAGEQPSA